MTETPAAPISRDPHHADIVAAAKTGKKRTQIAEEVGVTDRTVRRELEIEATIEATAPVAWESIPGPQRDKLERAKVTLRRELEKEYHAWLLAELDQRQAAMNEAFAKHKAEYDERNARINAMRDDERRRYQVVIEAQRSKGLISVDQYNLVRSCLHPDSRNSVTDEKLAEAFRVFNDPKVKALLVKEKP